jgi:PAS domain S-box-containing protein
MTKKPTYEELKQRIKDLEKQAVEHKRTEEALRETTRKLQVSHDQSIIYAQQLTEEITERKRIEKALRESEAKYREVVERANDGIAIIQDGLLKYINPCLARMTGHTVEGGIGAPFTDFVHPDEVSEAAEDFKRRMSGQPMPATYERALIHKDGGRIETEISGGIITYENEPADLIIIRDITERKRGEEKLRQTKEELEAQTHKLEEMNTALKVLIEQRERDRVELEETILSNVKQLVLIHVEMLQKSGLNAKQLAYLNILESNLKDIVSPFLRSLSSPHRTLTPREIQVADLIKNGKTSKEIAQLLNLSKRAIEFHRENIRAKLGLKNRPVNLRSHLMSLS